MLEMDANKLRVIEALRTAIRGGSINPLSAMAVITAGMEELNTIQSMTGTQKLATLEAALRDIAAGTDGVANTADDLIPPATLEALLHILNSGLLGDIVGAVLNASHGNYNLGLERIRESVARIDPSVAWVLFKPVVVSLAGWCMWRFFF
jgi:hypothetical protein